MRRLCWILAALPLLVLQTTSLGFFRGNFYFDLPLLFIYLFSMLYGALPGAAAGLLWGLLADLTVPGAFGFYTLTRAALGFAAGSMKEIIFKNNYVYHVLIVGMISVIARLLYLIPPGYRDGSLAFLQAYLMDSVCYVLGNMMLTVPLLLAMVRLDRWIREEDLKY